MATTVYTPIGEVAYHLQNNPNELIDDKLVNQIEEIIDLTLLRIPKKGLDETFLSLQDALFQLRLSLLSQRDLDIVLKELNLSLEKRIASQFSQLTPNKKLEQYFVRTISVSRTILTSQELQNIINSLTPAQKIIPTYEDTVEFLESLPGNDASLIVNQWTASLKIDFGLIVSELVFAQSLELSNEQIETLCQMLKNATEDYAVSCHALYKWEVPETDESQWMRNIKIRISLFDSQFVTNKYSTSDLSKVLV